MRASATLAAVVVAGLAATAGSGAGPAPVRVGGDWTRFGYDAARTNSGPAKTGITAPNLKSLVRQQVQIGGTADSSPIYLRGVAAGGRTRDLFVVTTSYGRAVAVDASSGRLAWRFTPPGYSSWAGSRRITNSSPIADPSRRYVYSAAPDGRIHKLFVASGREVRSGGWPAAITRLPGREKIGPALNFSRGLVLATTGGYIGDAPPYQGHVVSIDAASGRIVHVWNALCSDRSGLLDPSSCPESGAAIWARSGVVVEPGSGKLLVATGDGHWDGHTYWGDSVLELSPDAGRLLQNWTPATQADLDSGDADLGSTAPALLGNTRAVQGGKDAKLRLLDVWKLNGADGAGPRTGGELQTIGLPGGSGLFSAPAVWLSGDRTWLFVATFNGLAGYTLLAGRIHAEWERPVAGTSPVVAGGLLYVYDPHGGGLHVYGPATGRLLATLPAGPGHWNSPIVTDGRIALPEGNANDAQTSGVLNIYRLK